MARYTIVGILLVLCIAGWYFVYTINRTPEWYVKLDLWLQGHGLVQVMDPSQAEDVPDHFPHESMAAAWLVYSGDDYLGFITASAIFIPESTETQNNDEWLNNPEKLERKTRLTGMLEKAEFTMLGITFLMALILIVVIRRKRPAAKAVEQEE